MISFGPRTLDHLESFLAIFFTAQKCLIFSSKSFLNSNSSKMFIDVLLSIIEEAGGENKDRCAFLHI